VRNFPYGVTSSEASSPAIDQPSGKNAVDEKSQGWLEERRPRGQRVLSGRSGTRDGGRAQLASKQLASNMTSV